MSESSLNLAVEETTPKKTQSTKEVSGTKVDSAPAAVSDPSEPDTRSTWGLPAAIVLLVVGCSAVGIFGIAQNENADVLRSKMSVMQGEMDALQTTVTGLQAQNDGYQSRLTRIRAAAGSLQASLAELNELAGPPVPSEVAPPVVLE
ncbi:MAG: hypothetical protein CL908_24845 [Deltaproteobacteria bacterium]|nr:hypothetical protein [Deltaproteobacteria bacterium]